MTSETKQAFFARIRDALADRGPVTELPDDLEIARIVKTGADIVTEFATRVDQSGMHALRVNGESAVADEVARLAESMNAKTALLPEEAIPSRDAIATALAGGGVSFLDLNDPDAAFKADVGITGVAGGVAESGSLVVLSGGPCRRLASLAVPNHIAVIRKDQIVADLLDLPGILPGVTDGTLPSNVVLISGPSKTADIEMTLVEGVHGPETVHVIIVE